MRMPARQSAAWYAIAARMTGTAGGRGWHVRSARGRPPSGLVCVDTFGLLYAGSKGAGGFGSLAASRLLSADNKRGLIAAL